MRKLSSHLMQDLTTGFLSPLLKIVHLDVDLDFQIREDYFNIYYKGNSLLKLVDYGPGRYRPVLDNKFKGEFVFPDIVDQHTLNIYLEAIPKIKQNIILYDRPSIETEYEQLIIRANNYQSHNNSEYFILDRQVVSGKEGRFDLTGFYWNRAKRRKNQVVPLCLMEVKYALNKDIQRIHEQIQRYFEAVKPHSKRFAEEAEMILKQKLELGLFNQSKEQLEALKTISFYRDIDQFRIILVLVDYNPHSQLFARAKLDSLPFANQIRIFRTGMAMWDLKLETVESPLSLKNVCIQK
jgi:hypothetical protein